MGTKKLADFTLELESLLRDDATLLPPEDVEAAVLRAADGYSHDRPQSKKFDFAGDGATFDIPAPADWITGKSGVLSIEHPAGEREPVYLEADDWLLYTQVGGAQVIRLVATTPAAGQSARVEYSLPHTPPAADQATSAPDSDFYAICYLAAHHCFLTLAAKARQSIEPSFSADSVDRQAQADAYERMAARYLKLYKAQLGMDQESQPAAGAAIVDTDSETQAGVDFLTHPRRLR